VIDSVGFNKMGKLLITYFGFFRYSRGKGGGGNRMKQSTEFKEAYD